MCQKLPMLAFFAIFRPLEAAKLYKNIFFLVEEVLIFNLVGHMWKSVKNWLQKLVFNIYKWKWGRSRWIAYFENYLQKWLGVRYGEFPASFPARFPAEFPTRFLAEFPIRFPARFPVRFLTAFPTRFPARFPTRFPTRFPARFPTEFPTRFSLQDFPHKIFPSWILIGWLHITLFQMLNFHQSLPFLNWLFPLLPVPQDFPLLLRINGP